MSHFKYPYTGRNLFEVPESYFYAKCNNPEFYSSWLSYRHAAYKALSDISGKGKDDVNEIIYSSESLKGMMDDICEKMDDLKVAEIALEPLLKKFEVFRRFFTKYDNDFRRTDDSEPVGFAEYILFGELLAAFIERYRLKKHISTFLKLMDSICSVDFTELDTTSAKKCASLIKREIAIVKNMQ